ncbi:hypothetical protein CKM354_000729800 [Cercospora kikuchii]|uniref:Uncharacterized protein n=1 Tax=Cercospora kikuchii TaxID=84275 RepID=A0A9P3CJP7_9PEZI|nr:uncharacterized protein CKM354_000729800 [Cercospora kikuchii]GIZ44089.1 hypothetical protein CKM354_000729800 [Cercospora kikuchii]
MEDLTRSFAAMCLSGPSKSVLDDKDAYQKTTEAQKDREYWEMLINRHIISADTPYDVAMLLYGSANAYITPLLRRHRWIAIDDSDYVRLLPSIVLASHFFESRRAMVFWHALFEHGGLPDPQTGLVTFGRMGNDKYTELSPADHDKTRARLRSLENIVLKCDHEMRTGCDCFGETISEPMKGKDRFHPGSAILRLNGKYVDEIDFAGGAKHDVLRRIFIIAATIVHELAHAICTAARCPWSEMAWEEDGFVEMGWALEKWLFGGQPMILNKTLQAPGFDYCVATETLELVTLGMRMDDDRSEGVNAGRAPVETTSGKTLHRLEIVDDAWLDEIFDAFLYRGD